MNIEQVNQPRHLAVRNQAYKQVVQRAGDGTNYNWRRFGVFDYPIGADHLGSPVETWYTAAQSYSTYETGKGLASIPATTGLTLKDHSSNTDMILSSSTATDYGMFALGALAYAKEHGATDADAGWTRITSESNFSAFSSQTGNPGHGLYPRGWSALPSWVPSAGTFSNINTNTLNAIKPASWPTSGDIAGPFSNWSGGVFASNYSTLGAYVVYGSGHLTSGATLWEGVNVFDLDTLSWSIICRPVTAHTEGTAFNSFGEFADGHPTPPHTYDGLIYQPSANGGGAKGSLLRNYFAGTGAPLTNNTAVHRFDLAVGGTNAPTRILDALSPAGGTASYPAMATDTSRGGWWATNANGQSSLRFVAFSTWAITTYSASFNAYGDQSIIYLPAPYDCLVAMGRDGGGGVNMSVRVCLLSPTPQGWVTVTQSGTPPTDRRCGGVWSTLLNCIVSYQAAGSYAVHKLTPPAVGSLTRGTWVWTSETLTGNSGATPCRTTATDNGAWSRFIEVPAARCFIWCDSVTGPVQAWRLTGM